MIESIAGAESGKCTVFLLQKLLSDPALNFCSILPFGRS